VASTTIYLGEILTQNDAQVVDLQLHMTVKSLAIIQGEINCKLRELVKKTELMTEKEEEGEESNYLLELILDDLTELTELFKQRKSLQNQIEKLKFTVVGTLPKTNL
jgi:hypothetical protein